MVVSDGGAPLTLNPNRCALASPEYVLAMLTAYADSIGARKQVPTARDKALGLIAKMSLTEREMTVELNDPSPMIDLFPTLLDKNVPLTDVPIPSTRSLVDLIGMEISLSMLSLSLYDDMEHKSTPGKFQASNLKALLRKFLAKSSSSHKLIVSSLANGCSGVPNRPFVAVNVYQGVSIDKLLSHVQRTVTRGVFLTQVCTHRGSTLSRIKHFTVSANYGAHGAVNLDLRDTRAAESLLFGGRGVVQVKGQIHPGPIRNRVTFEQLLGRTVNLVFRCLSQTTDAYDTSHTRQQAHHTLVTPDEPEPEEEVDWPDFDETGDLELAGDIPDYDPDADAYSDCPDDDLEDTHYMEAENLEALDIEWQTKQNRLVAQLTALAGRKKRVDTLEPISEPTSATEVRPPIWRVNPLVDNNLTSFERSLPSFTSLQGSGGSDCEDDVETQSFIFDQPVHMNSSTLGVQMNIVSDSVASLLEAKDELTELDLEVKDVRDLPQDAGALENTTAHAAKLTALRQQVDLLKQRVAQRARTVQVETKTLESTADDMSRVWAERRKFEAKRRADNDLAEAKRLAAGDELKNKGPQRGPRCPCGIEWKKGSDILRQNMVLVEEHNRVKELVAHQSTCGICKDLSLMVKSLFGDLVLSWSCCKQLGWLQTKLDRNKKPFLARIHTRVKLAKPMMDLHYSRVVAAGNGLCWYCACKKPLFEGLSENGLQAISQDSKERDKTR
jgi:hypothetical protein